MSYRVNRTFVCSVLFLDIVGYSKRSVVEQMKLKQRLNVVLREALLGVPVGDRIVLDTGDGAAISFLGCPEESLFVALDLCAAFSVEPEAGEPVSQVRIGINLGPVRIINDLNGQQNIVGDGINVAERVSGFAEPGQILVSRSYYEVMSRLSDDYGRVFRHEGLRTDKHVREHAVFSVDLAGVIPVRPYLPAGGRFARLRWALTANVVSQYAGARDELRSSVVALASVLAIAIVALGWTIRVGGVASDAASEAASDAAVSAATVSLAIVPWGEVYVDGKMQGVSPPLKHLIVAPGRHDFEIRNSDFPVYKKRLEAKSGVPIQLEHRFK